MVIRTSSIKDKFISALKDYKAVEYESRHVIKRGNFQEKETEMINRLDMPFNILKVGAWDMVQVAGVKTKIWRPSGEEVLQRSGILSWQEDLQHLRNQLSMEQP